MKLVIPLTAADLAHAAEVFANDFRILRLIDLAWGGDVKAQDQVQAKLKEAGY